MRYSTVEIKCIWLAIGRTPTTAISTAALIYNITVPIAEYVTLTVKQCQFAVL